MAKQLILIMGVSGTGKSTIAQGLANELAFTYLDADDFHSEQAKKMMANGQAINDDIRAIWIENMLNFLTDERHQEQSYVLAYSGLKYHQRKRFEQLNTDLLSCFLVGDRQLIAERMANRVDHFFSPKLLTSQFDDLELPSSKLEEHIHIIDITTSADNVITHVLDLYRHNHQVL